MENLIIRKAAPEDFHKVYELGASTPELLTSSEHPFHGKNEFQKGFTDPASAIFLAEASRKLAGFIYGDVEAKDLDGKKWACLMYIVVRPEFRGKGVAQKLFDAFSFEAKSRGATHLYSWANSEEGSVIMPFFEKQGLKPGHLYRWMDKEL